MAAPWAIVYSDLDSSLHPVRFLNRCPKNVQARMAAVLRAVSLAPPPQFSGGGMWEAMHGDMHEYYEIRVTGPGREQFRLFCFLENSDDPAELARRGLPGPAISVIAGMRKPHRTVFSVHDYDRVARLGMEYRATYPRPIVQ